MTASSVPESSPPISWQDIICSDQSAAATWTHIFQRLQTLALATTSPATLHRETVTPDRLLAETAWDLWQQVPTAAPSAIAGIRDFWQPPITSAGTAVLILDALSLRELPLIINGAKKRGIEPANISVRASVVPTETDQFAAALGLPGRAKLAHNQPPASFIFNGPDVYTDVLADPFADCVGRIGAQPRLFLWHNWPDEPLIHLHSNRPDGDAVVGAEIKRTLASDGFWNFLDRLRQGRRLLITSDHGYATTAEFSSEVKTPEDVRGLAGQFGAQRAIREDPASPWLQRQFPPPVLRFPDAGGAWLVVTGQRKWKVSGGFPTLCHRGLSLLEAAVPMIELSAL
ncbi:MAG: hypothetical protein ACP5I8_08995 [Phycisphaerae bacterium]